MDKIEELIEEMKAYINELGSIYKPIFAGRRQGLEMINSKVSKQDKFIHDIEFFNYDLLSSPRFFNYSDWEKNIRKVYPILNQFKDEGSKSMSSVYGTRSTGISPASLINMEFIRPKHFSLNRDKNAHFSVEGTEDPINPIESMVYLNGNTQEIPSGLTLGKIRYMAELEAFKFRLKSTENLNETLELVSKLAFI